ncbi:NYN domain-containing protein [Candidatus Dependentiae bacterium]
MILLIDGYNLIKQVMLRNKISEFERKRFINQLGKYHKIKGHKIELVFDGGEFDFPTKDRINGVYVIYSGYGESADDFIKRYLDEHKALDILLVSSDRDICNFAAKLGIDYLDSKIFYNLMQESLKVGTKKRQASQEKARKIAETENKELDALMQEASKVIEYKVEDFEAAHGGKRESGSGKLSKKERRKLKKIKKL